MTSTSTSTSPWQVGDCDLDPDQLGEFMAAVMRQAYPAQVRETIIARSCEPDRLSRIRAERTWFQVADAGTVIGVVCVHLDDPLTGYVSSLMVSRRGVGVGGTLARAAVAWAAQKGASRVHASVHPWNTASLATFASLGFEVTGRSADGWVGSGDILDLQGPAVIAVPVTHRPARAGRTVGS